MIDRNRAASVNSINLSDLMNNSSNSSTKVFAYDVEHVPEKIVNPTGHFKGFCKIPAWAIFVISNVVLLVCIAAVGTVLGLTLTKSSSADSKCSSNSDCDNTVGLICSGGYCSCITTQYWDVSKCTNKKAANSTCASSKECDDKIILTCVNTITNQSSSNVIGTGVCTCDSSRFWNGSQCVYINSYNGACLTTQMNACNPNYGLFCNPATNSCSCDTTSQFWSGSNCVTYKIYLESCQSDTYCLMNTSLFCQTQGINAGLCDCPTKQYWDGTKCQPVKTYSDTCGYQAQCDQDQILICPVSGTNALKCSCAQNKYWSGTICSVKATINETCNSNSTCDDSVLLYCSSNKCICNVQHYWDGDFLSCLPKKAIAGSCSSNMICDANANLLCGTSGSSVGSCSCPSSTFWNGTACQTKLTWKVNCTSTLQCNDALSLYCSSTSQFASYQICDCASAFYFDNTVCRAKKSIGVPCTTSYECEDFSLLICNTTLGKCACPVTDYWNGSSCVQKKLYTVPCLSDGECDDFRYLYCPNTIGGCNCPFLSTGYYCDCRSDSFWDSATATCKIKGTYKDSCPNGNFECNLSGTGLNCTNNICDCPAKADRWFWNSVLCKKCPLAYSLSDYCYKPSTFTTDWNNAKNFCKTIGGTLMVITSDSELNNFPASYVANVGDIIAIGANTQSAANSWVWENGISLSTTNKWWCSGWDTSKKCAGIRRLTTTSFCLTSIDCATSYNFLCEYF